MSALHDSKNLTALLTTFSILIVLSMLMLSACAKKQSRKPVILGERLLKSYDLSCRTCHESPDSGAPLTHDSNVWDKRLETTMVQLIQNTIDGVGAMPPMGQCFECDEGDIRQLVEYMASPGDASEIMTGSNTND